MPDLLSKASFTGTAVALLANDDRTIGFETVERSALSLRFSGIEGDSHGGLTRASDSRMLKQFRRGTIVRNARQISIISEEELAETASAMGIPAVKPEWLGANLVTRGIPALTLLPPSTRLQSEGGATIVVDMENLPCRYPAGIIERHHPEQTKGFVAAARNRRGVVGWVESEGEIRNGDSITVWLPPKRLYSFS